VGIVTIPLCIEGAGFQKTRRDGYLEASATHARGVRNDRDKGAIFVSARHAEK
jgi:hypothetical protein